MSIEKNFHRYLFNLVKSSAMDNKVAKTIALNYQRLNLNGKEKLFESLIPAFLNFTETAFSNITFENPVSTEPSVESKDFRLKAIRIANVRGIPKLASPYKYGIDLCEGNQIQNGVFLGPNGTGKSSLFNAIEFIYSHEVAEKKLRVAHPEALKEKDYIEYLEHFNAPPECEIQTPSGNFSLREKVFKTNEQLRTIYPDSHFISDYDIYKNGQLEFLGGNNNTDSFHFLIASSLGLQDYLDFTALLKSLSSYRRSKESSERNKHITFKKQKEDIIKTHQEEIEAKSLKIEELKKSDATMVQNDTQKRLFGTITSIKSTNLDFPFNEDQYRSIFERYEDAQDTYSGLSVNQTLQTEAQFLSLGLELINHSENCPFCESSNLSAVEIKRKIENRLTEIKDFESAAKNLEQSIGSIQSVVKDSLMTIDKIGRMLRSEIEKIDTIPELSHIAKEEKEIINLLAEKTRTLVNVNDEMERISSSTDTLAKRNEIINRVIKEAEETLKIEMPVIPEAIKKFAIFREQEIITLESSSAQNPELILPTQQIAILESEIQVLSKNIANAEQEIKELNNAIDQLTTTIDVIVEIRNQAGEFARILSAAVNELVSNSFEPIKETIESILSDYLRDEGVDIKIRLEEKAIDSDSDSFITTIVAEIQTFNKETSEFENYSPSKYFNTFRFRLFCTMVSISIIIAARINSGINLPLVLDDVFYASDYNSKITFRDFIIKVLRSFKKFNGELPLQFILFTHDELVFDSALDAISEFGYEENLLSDNQGEDSEWKESIQDRTIFARLFSPNDVDPNATQSPFGNYWDLSYKIPTRIDQLIKN